MARHVDKKLALKESFCRKMVLVSTVGLSKDNPLIVTWDVYLTHVSLKRGWRIMVNVRNALLLLVVRRTQITMVCKQSVRLTTVKRHIRLWRMVLARSVILIREQVMTKRNVFPLIALLSNIWKLMVLVGIVIPSHELREMALSVIKTSVMIKEISWNKTVPAFHVMITQNQTRTTENVRKMTVLLCLSLPNLVPVRGALFMRGHREMENNVDQIIVTLNSS
jgi:hypothetical protein